MLGKKIIDNTANKDEADALSKYSATLYIFSQSLGPLLLGFLSSDIVLGTGSSMYLFPAAGAILLIFILFNKIKKDKQWLKIE